MNHVTILGKDIPCMPKSEAELKASAEALEAANDMTHDMLCFMSEADERHLLGCAELLIKAGWTKADPSINKD